jgi:two-component system response regulator YesN
LLVAACDEIIRKPIPDTDTMEKIAHLLSCILLIMKDRVKQTGYNPLTLKIMQYLHSNFSEKITLDDIARLTFFSPNYCENVFKRETGRSVIDYLLQIRIEEAKRLLAEDSLALSTVAEAVGFDDYNYFSRVFKKRTGYTPSEYKKLISL